ncbi:MAG: hypothetical protein WC074_08120 [bacterium]|jgi:hypothetical protein
MPLHIRRYTVAGREIMILIYRVLGIYMLVRILELTPSIIFLLSPNFWYQTKQGTVNSVMSIIGTILPLFLFAIGAYVLLKYSTKFADCFFTEQGNGIDYERLQNVLLLTAGVIVLINIMPAFINTAIRIISQLYYGVVGFTRGRIIIPWISITTICLQTFLGLYLIFRPEVVSKLLKKARTNDG